MTSSQGTGLLACGLERTSGCSLLVPHPLRDPVRLFSGLFLLAS